MPGDRLGMPDLPAERRYTAGRYLQALADRRAWLDDATPFGKAAALWLDRGQVVTALKAGVGATEAGDFPPALIPIADSFLAAMRGFSVPLRLQGLRRVPMRTRLYINASGVTAAEVLESKPIPVLKGDWTWSQLLPRKFAGIAVQTNELMRSPSPTATLAIVDDLATAVAEAENTAFVNPSVAGSVLYGADNFAGTGTAVAQVDADLRSLVDSVPGAEIPGAAFVMTKETATFLSLLRGSGGAAAYPDISPQGGELLHLPVLITSACAIDADSPPTRIIGLVNPGEILWADEGRVVLSTSTAAMLEMSGTPTGATDTPVTASQEYVSLFQTDSTATKALRESNWLARAGSGGYFTTSGSY